MTLISYALWFALGSITSFTYLFCAYILTMTLYDKYKGTRYEILVKVFVVIPFGLLDALVNILVITPWFLEWPRQWMVTDRLKSWRKSYEDKNYLSLSSRQQRRLIFAVWICDTHLDHYDKLTGNHC